jgi:hypothetical protein
MVLSLVAVAGAAASIAPASYLVDGRLERRASSTI